MSALLLGGSVALVIIAGGLVWACAIIAHQNPHPTTDEECGE